MSLSLILSFIWVLVAAILAAIPSGDNLWRRAYILLAVGLPLLGFVFYQNGPWVGLFIFAIGASILRWPLVYLWRWLRAKVTG